MKVIQTVCFPGAAFRRAALIGGGGLRPEDGVNDDIPLLMRIATEWDFAYIDRPLTTVTSHAGASSSPNGSFTPRGIGDRAPSPTRSMSEGGGSWLRRTFPRCGRDD